MAEGSAHLCRCTFSSTILLFLLALILVIAAFNINLLQTLFDLDAVGQRNVTTKGHVFSTVQITTAPSQNVTINVGLANYNITGINNATTFVLMLHAFPESWDICWNSTFDYLRTDWVYILPDIRGSGGSSAPSGVQNYNITTLATDIFIVAQQLTFNTSFHLVGVDFGGLLAFTVASMFPSYVKTLTVFNSPHPVALGLLLSNSTDQQTRAQPSIGSWLNPLDTSYQDNNFQKLSLWMDPFGNSTWWLNYTNAYKNLWANRWNQLVLWYRANILLNGASNFSANTTVSFPNNITYPAYPIRAVTRIYIAQNETLYSLPSAVTFSGAYPLVDYKKFINTGGAQPGGHWIHHTNPSAVGNLIQNAVLSPTS